MRSGLPQRATSDPRHAHRLGRANQRTTRTSCPCAAPAAVARKASAAQDPPARAQSRALAARRASVARLLPSRRGYGRANRLRNARLRGANPAMPRSDRPKARNRFGSRHFCVPFWHGCAVVVRRWQRRSERLDNGQQRRLIDLLQIRGESLAHHRSESVMPLSRRNAEAHATIAAMRCQHQNAATIPTAYTAGRRARESQPLGHGTRTSKNASSTSIS